MNHEIAAEQVITAPDGSKVRVRIVGGWEPGTWALAVDGVNCLLDGYEPGRYLLLGD